MLTTYKVGSRDCIDDEASNSKHENTDGQGEQQTRTHREIDLKTIHT